MVEKSAIILQWIMASNYIRIFCPCQGLPWQGRNMRIHCKILALFSILGMTYYAIENPALCDITPDCHYHNDASGTSNAMFDELAERSLMSPLAGAKH